MTSVDLFAQARCGDLFAQQSLDSRSLAALKSLHNTSEDFRAFLSTKSGQILEQNEIQGQMNEVVARAETYLLANGIKFKKETAIFRNLDVNGVRIPLLTYENYKILDSNTGTEIGRVINGLRVSKKLADINLIYDPFLHIRKSDTGAYFSDISKRIYITYTAFSKKALGIGDPLRHEIQHAFEDYKLRRGQKTLAGFSLHGQSLTDRHYERYLRLDEIESYIRDIRTLSQPRLSVRKNMSDSNQVKFETIRQDELRRNKQFLKGMLEKAKALIHELESIQGPQKIFQDGALATLVFSDLKNPYYQTLEFRVLVTSQRNMNQLFKEHLSWAKARILDIENELQRLEM